jgi:two-component system chemotaxis response regulator CheY
MPRTVLLIDDSATIRAIAGRALVHAGFVVVEAVDGFDGMEKLGSTANVSLIVCDINMPRMSGLELLERLATQSSPHPPVLMLTSEGHPQLVQRAKAHGAKGWMVKPFKSELLVAAARKLTGS